jgi:hypothetical protein
MLGRKRMTLKLIAGLLVGLAATPANAQIGNIFGNPKPMTARSAWAELPPAALSCIEQSLRATGSSVNNLIQQNVYPNSPQYRDVIAKCQASLRPKIQDASVIVTSPTWATLSPEQQFAFFLETFWIDRRQPYYKCGDRIRGEAYAAQKACLIKNGFDFRVDVTKKCFLTVTEQVPPADQPQRTWDGKIASGDIVTRELSFPLTGLDAGLIQRHSEIFDLYVEIRDKSDIKQRIAMSTDPTNWISLPPPPMAADVASSLADEKSDALTRRRIEWRTNVSRYGNVDIPNFDISTYTNQRDTNSEAGLNRLRANQLRTFVKVSTASFPHAFFINQASDLMTNACIATVKSIISDCSK